MKTLSQDLRANVPALAGLGVLALLLLVTRLTGAPFEAVALGALGLVLVLLLLLAPAFVAHARHHPDRLAIAVLCLTLGWTGIAWAIALVWAVKRS